MAYARVNPVGDMFRAIDDGAAAAATLQQITQARTFIFLRIKRILADLVHDFGRQFLDDYIDPGTLVDFLTQGVPLPAVTPVERQALLLFYAGCTTDAKAKIEFKNAKEAYMTAYGIAPSVRTVYTLTTIDQGGDEGQLWAALGVINAAAGAPAPFRWYLDAQTGNPIRSYEVWRRAQAAGVQLPPNGMCQDLAIKADPATKWGGEGYLTPIVRLAPLSFPGNVIGTGLTYTLTAAAAAAGVVFPITSSWGAGMNRIITNNNNSITEIKGEIIEIGGNVLNAGVTPAVRSTRVRTCLGKPSGDADQGYTVSSQLWPDGEAVKVYTTNDILECEDKDMYNTGHTLLTGPTEITHFNYGAVPNPNLTAAETAQVYARFPGTAALLQQIGTQVEAYFTMVFNELQAGRTARFQNVLIGAPAPANSALSIADSARQYHVSFQAPGPNLVLAHVAGSLIDLIEKCYIYETMLYRANKILTTVAPVAGQAVLPVEYRPFVSDVDMRTYLDVYSIFKPRVLQGELNTIFSRDNLGYDSRDALYNELVYTFHKYVTAPDIPKNIISLFLVVAFMQLTLRPVPVRGDLLRLTRLRYEHDNRIEWSKKFFTSPSTRPFIRAVLLQYVTGILPNGAPFIGNTIPNILLMTPAQTLDADNATFLRADFVSSVDSFANFIHDIISICFVNTPQVFAGGIGGRARDIEINNVSEFLVNIRKTEAVKIALNAPSPVIAPAAPPPPPRFFERRIPVGSLVRRNRELARVEGPARALIVMEENLKRVLTQICSGDACDTVELRGIIRDHDPLGAKKIKDIIETHESHVKILAASAILPLKIRRALQTGGAYNSEPVEEEMPDDPPLPDSYITMAFEIVPYLRNILAGAEFTIFEAQEIIAKAVTATIGMNDDPNACLIYALPPVYQFRNVKDPSKIVEAYDSMKDHGYISNGVWPALTGSTIFDEMMDAFRGEMPDATAANEEEFNKYLNDLLEEDQSIEELRQNILFLKEQVKDPVDELGLWTLTPARALELVKAHSAIQRLSKPTETTGTVRNLGRLIRTIGELPSPTVPEKKRGVYTLKNFPTAPQLSGQLVEVDAGVSVRRGGSRSAHHKGSRSARRKRTRRRGSRAAARRGRTFRRRK
jgi:hypothetical protein